MDESEKFINNLMRIVLDKGGIARLSEKTGLGRESLYKTLSEKGNPKLKTILSICKCLDIKISVERIKK